MVRNKILCLSTVLLICLVNKVVFAQSPSSESSRAIASVQGSPVLGNVELLPKLVSGLPSPIKKKLNLSSVTKIRKALKAPFIVKGRNGTSFQLSRAQSSNSNMVPYAYGGYAVPYTTARVATGTNSASTAAADVPVTGYPYRAVGKLYFKIGSSNYVCSATLVKKGVLLTAAHCVFEFGTDATTGFFTNFVFCPAHNSAKSPFGPYGCYPANKPRVLVPYYDGTDTCDEDGVVCNNDIATLLVPQIKTKGPNKGKYVGTVYGIIPYSYNAYSFVNNYLFEDVPSAQITQLGYPAAIDSGVQMQRTDSLSRLVHFDDDETDEVDGTFNIIMGTAMTGGSSGGPWIVNFGTRPLVSSSASLGYDSYIAIAGVASWGYSSVGLNLQGASYFGNNNEYPDFEHETYGGGNIGKLMYDTCTNNSGYC